MDAGDRLPQDARALKPRTPTQRNAAAGTVERG